MVEYVETIIFSFLRGWFTQITKNLFFPPRNSNGIFGFFCPGVEIFENFVSGAHSTENFFNMFFSRNNVAIGTISAVEYSSSGNCS